MKYFINLLIISTNGCVSAGRKEVTVRIIQKLAAPVVSVSTTTNSSATFSWPEVQL